MKVKLTLYKRDHQGKQIYNDRIPQTEEIITDLPLKLGYGSYNEPRKILNIGKNADDLISIEPVE